MVTIILLLLVFLGIGLFFREFNTWPRLLMIIVIVGVLAYLYIT
ncbi:MAG TPA: hypothetical protein VJ761_23030 [Ktedonobacteraceae bacterium]|nr:hypothetical protein [Ktedonobacteraceae bacterium]